MLYWEHSYHHHYSILDILESLLDLVEWFVCYGILSANHSRKSHIIQQESMLGLQRWLMAAASLGTVVVLQQVSLGVCVVSLALNFTDRHHDVLNTMMIASGVLLSNE